MKDHNFYMHIAINEALRGKKTGEPPFAGIIVKDGKVISKAHDTVRYYGDYTHHSETDLVRKACKILGPDLSECTVYATCEPCPLCFGALWLAKVKTVVFGSYIPDVLKITGSKQRELDVRAEWLNKKTGNQIKLIKGVLRRECIDLWKE